MADELDETIENAAKNPRRAKGDSGEMESHPLGDQIAADKYLASKKAARGRGLGIRITHMRAGGATE
jgi:hypothetical protein